MLAVLHGVVRNGPRTVQNNTMVFGFDVWYIVHGLVHVGVWYGWFYTCGNALKKGRKDFMLSETLIGVKGKRQRDEMRMQPIRTCCYYILSLLYWCCTREVANRISSVLQVLI